MSKNLQFTRSMALAALVALASSAAQANITVYNTTFAFNAATISRGTDTFSDLSNQTTTPSPLARTTVGTVYNYVAAASTSSFFPGDENGDVFLSPNISNDSILLSGFNGPISALGGNFFGSDYPGNYQLGNLTLKVIDGSGEHLVNIVAAETTTFVGLVSDSNIVSVEVFSVTPDANNADVWPAVDNLVLGIAAVVPEPETYALMLSGLAFVGFVARRRAGRNAS